VLFVFILLLSNAFAGPVAEDPSPEDGTTGVPVDSTLTWAAGSYVGDYVEGKTANGHHVFVHTNKTWVDGAALGYPLGTNFGHYRTQTASWQPTDAVPFGCGAPLDTNTAYYWRIFEVNSVHPDSPWKSDVWSFATIGPKAADPYPEDEGIGAPLNVILAWRPGTDIAYSPNGGHDVYFGTDLAAVTDANTSNPLGVYQGCYDPNNYPIGPLDMLTTYYWRIDEANDASGTVTGDVWSFTAAGLTASDPGPADDSLVGELYESSVDVTLSWKAGAYAADVDGHDVYFGTNFDEVNDLNNTDPDPNDVYKGPQTPTTYPLLSLPLDVTYYWRIDEVNDAHPDAIWKGPVWSFTPSSGRALNPDPPDGAEWVSVESLLSWRAGYDASSRDVYFGTTSPPPLIGGQTATTYDPGRMKRGQTYYWRIDEKNSLGPKQGHLWSFRTSGFTPSYPGQVGVNTEPQFVDWAREMRNYNRAGGGALTISDLDTNGWPERDFEIFRDLRLVAEWEGYIDDPEEHRYDYSGTYKCSFTGQADVAVIYTVGSIQNKSYNAGTNTTTFDFVLPTPGPGHMSLIRFTNTKRTPASPTGSGLTNLKIVRPGYPLSTTQRFTDDFLNAFTSADWACWRNQTVAAHDYPDTQEWSERKRADDCPALWRYSDGKLESLPWEDVIELSNLTGVSPWISIPVSATDDYITKCAQMLEDELDPDIDIYVELSNEVWNSGFDCYHWNAAEANDLGLLPNENYARRVINMAQLFESVFGAGSLHNRLKVILAGHHVCLSVCVPHTMDNMLNYIASEFGPPKTWIYALSTTNYFTADPNVTTGTVEQLLDSCMDSIKADRALRRQWIQTAEDWDLPGGCTTYEAGFHTPCCGELTNLDNQFILHRVPEAFDVLKYNHDDNWLGLGGSLTNHFVLYGAWSRWGCWGATDDVSIPDRNYKLQAVRQVMGNLTCDFNGDDIVDFKDFAALAAEWGTGGDTDLNGDGTVDNTELLKLALDWMWTESQ